MSKIKNNKGFTLIEIVIAIAILAIGISIVTLSINIVFRSNTESYAEQFVADLRRMRNDSLYAVEKEYKLTWAYDATDGYSYKIIYTDTSTVPSTDVLVKEVKIRTDITVQKDETIYNSLEDYTDLENLLPAHNEIKFNTSDGSITGDGHGIYKLISNGTGNEYIVYAIPTRGRVYLDE